jgi:two-component system, cell cycle response regulator DivK
MTTRVLIVDDFADTREMYALYLRLSGLEVTEAETGEQALEMVRADLPDLVLMDLSLPGTDGFAVTRELKEDPRTRDIPVVALTAHAVGSHIDRARSAGCVDFIVKPAPPNEVLAAIRKALAP